jgi:hypothetical protein
MNIMGDINQYGQQSDNDPGFTRTEPSSYDDPGMTREPSYPYNDPGFTRTSPFDQSRFGPNIPVGQPPRIGQNNTPDDIQATIDAINKVYTPETRASNRFNDLLDRFPEREEPSFARRLVAAGVGLGNRSRGIPGGIGEQEKVLYAPHIRDLADFGARVGPFGQATQFENAANANERALAQNVVTSITAGNKQAEQSRIADERNRTNQERIMSNERIQQQRIQLDNLVRTGTVDKVINDGKDIIIVYKDGRTVNTGMDGKAVTTLELAALNNNAKLAQIGEKGNQDRQTEGTKQEGRVVIQNMPSRSSMDVDTPNEAATRRKNAIQTVWDKYPEYHKYIDLENYQIKDPPKAGWISGVSAKEKENYDKMKNEINKLISGNSSRVGTNTNKPGDNLGGVMAGGGVKPRYQQDPDTGEIRVSHDGGRNWQPYRRGGQ